MAIIELYQSNGFDGGIYPIQTSILKGLIYKMKPGQKKQFHISGSYGFYNNRSYQYQDITHDGNGIFKFLINGLNQPVGKLTYNEVLITLDLTTIYKDLYTPYLNASRGDNKYRVTDVKYVYVINDIADDVRKAYMNSPINRKIGIGVCAKLSNVYNYRYIVGPTPEAYELNRPTEGAKIEWNRDYKHHYVGPSWKLADNQSYAEYYARAIYWWDETKENDINELLNLSRTYHGKFVGSVSDIENNNKAYSELLVNLLNYFSKQDTNPDTREWFVGASNSLDMGENDHNLYGCKIICDSNTRGLVIEIPLTRRGPVGKLFLPLIKPGSGYYTPTNYRCDFDHFLWYFIPWEKDNSLRFLMLTDSEVAEVNDNKVKAYVATRRGHTKDDMPYMDKEDFEQLNSYWGYGYHYRLDPNRLFDGGVTIKIPQLATFDKSEKALFEHVHEQTGVRFPIENNQITYKTSMGGLTAEVIFTGTRSSVLFMPTPINITIIDDSVHLFSLFGRDNTKLISDPIGVKEVDMGLIRSDEPDQPLIIDLSNLTYTLNFNRLTIRDEFKQNYDMLKLFKTGDITSQLPEVQVKYLTEILKLYASYSHFGYYKDEKLIPDYLLVNINDCEVVYNGLNSSEKSGQYTRLSGYKNLLVLKPLHGIYSIPFTRWIILSYED